MIISGDLIETLNGKTERGPPPESLSSSSVLEQLEGVENVIFGKNDNLKHKRGPRYLVHQWKKRSCLFELPYWKDLLLRHNLDVIHVEKSRWVMMDPECKVRLYSKIQVIQYIYLLMFWFAKCLN